MNKTAQKYLLNVSISDPEKTFHFDNFSFITNLHKKNIVDMPVYASLTMYSMASRLPLTTLFALRLLTHTLLQAAQ